MYILRSCHLHVFHLHSFTMLRCSLLFRSISIKPRLSSLSVNPFASAGQMGKWCVCEWEVMAEFQRKIVYIAYSLHTKKKHRETGLYVSDLCFDMAYRQHTHTEPTFYLVSVSFSENVTYVCEWDRTISTPAHKYFLPFHIECRHRRMESIWRKYQSSNDKR